MQVAGSAHGVCGLAAAVQDGLSAARRIAATLGLTAFEEPSLPVTPADAPRADLEPCWEIAGKGKALLLTQ